MAAMPDAQAETLLGKARELAPVLRERAAETNRRAAFRNRPSSDFWDAGLWYLLKPKKFGGPELRPDVALALSSELSRADGSAGWVWAVLTIHDLLVALWPEEFQHEYWAKNTLSASSFAPTGKATPASGGYRVSGKWTFCRGIDNSDWLLLGTFFGPPPAGSPVPDIRYVMIPTREAQDHRRLARVRAARHRQQGHRGGRRVRAKPPHLSLGRHESRARHPAPRSTTRRSTRRRSGPSSRSPSPRRPTAWRAARSTPSSTT